MDNEQRAQQRRISLNFLENSSGYAVRVPNGQKNPGKGWDPKSNTKEKSEITLHALKNEAENDNLGVHLHGNLVDVDVDTDDASCIAALDAFLPSCSHTWGRKSRPRTHRVYAVREDMFEPGAYPFLRRLKKIKEVSIEIRGGDASRGEYSLLPGSVHPSGEIYTWHDENKAQNSVSFTDVSLLTAAVRKAAAVGLLAPYWAEGARNDLTMALTGFLYRTRRMAESFETGKEEEEGPIVFSMDRDEAESFVMKLCEIAGDDPADKQARLKTFRMTWRKGDQDVPITGANSIGEITGDPQIVRNLYALLTDNPNLSEWEDFVDRFAIWTGHGTVIDMQSVTGNTTEYIMTRHQFSNSYGHLKLDIGGKPRLMADLLFGYSAAQRLNGLTFAPDHSTKIVTELTDRSKQEIKKYNQWTGFDIDPWPEDVKDDEVIPFIRYLYDIVCDKDDESYSWVVNWIAAIFQKPAVRSETALVLVGIPGAGKSILGHSIISPIIGRTHSASTNSVEDITSNFNASFNNCLFIQCDEATSNRQRVTANKMKSLITDPYMFIEPKGIDRFEVPNLIRFLLTSNEMMDAVFISDGKQDRRYTVLEVSDKQAGNVDGYWEPFIKWLKDENGKPNKLNLSKIHKWLLQHPLDMGAIRRPLLTQAKVNMQQQSADPFDKWLVAMVARDHPISEHLHKHAFDAYLDKFDRASIGKLDRENWPNVVRYKVLCDDYHSFAKSIGERYERNLDEAKLAKNLKDRGLLNNDVDKTYRLRVQYYDKNSENTVTARPRLRTFPTRKKIELFLERKYGVEFEELNDDIIIKSEKITDVKSEF